MGKTFEIQSAIYGKSSKKDVDISEYLLQNRYRLSKEIPLSEQFGDPYPNDQKYVLVQFQVTDERTEVYEEDGFQIKNGGTKIGFEPFVPFEIDIPNFYRYHIIDASFEIISMVVRPAQYANREEIIVVEPSQWDTFVKRTDDGYYVVQEHVDLVEWMGADPFPYRQKVIELNYRRRAVYGIQVYEHGGYLMKDLVLLAELPLYRLHMVYHMYPKFDHHLLPMHKRYIDKCHHIFSRVMVSIANENEQDEDRNKELTESLFQYTHGLEIMHSESDTQQKDGKSFPMLLEASNTTSSDYTFYCHSKGLTEYQLLILPNVACWIELAYIEALSNIDLVIEQNANFAGSFMERSHVDTKLVSWNYPGSFYWVKSSLVNRFVTTVSLMEQAKKTPDIAKIFPKLMCPQAEGCLDLLTCKEGMHDMYNRQCVLQFKTLIEVCTKDPISRKAVGLL